MTTMGCKKTTEPRKGFGAGKEVGEAYKALMRQFEGQPCTLCGSKGIKLFGGRIVPTVGHHILFQSTHPEYRLVSKNIIPLCPTHHRFAHDYPEKFKAVLENRFPAIFKWNQEHNHHRREC